MDHTLTSELSIPRHVLCSLSSLVLRLLPSPPRNKRQSIWYEWIFAIADLGSGRCVLDLGTWWYYTLQYSARPVRTWLQDSNYDSRYWNYQVIQVTRSIEWNVKSVSKSKWQMHCLCLRSTNLSLFQALWCLHRECLWLFLICLY